MRGDDQGECRECRDSCRVGSVREDQRMQSRCRLETFATLADAQGTVLERRARSTLAGSERLELTAYECECGQAHIVRTRDRCRAA